MADYPPIYTLPTCNGLGLTCATAIRSSGSSVSNGIQLSFANLRFTFSGWLLKNLSIVLYYIILCYIVLYYIILYYIILYYIILYYIILYYIVLYYIISYILSYRNSETFLFAVYSPMMVA